MTMLKRMISDIYFFSWSYYRLKIQCNNFGGNNLANIGNCKERTACTDTVASQAVLC